MPHRFPRCRVVPLPDRRVSFQVDGQERLGWHFGSQAPRPFFYPLTGPSGTTLTRMGHPGAPNHDHHRSIWFAHHQVLGIDFWSEGTPAAVVQERWLSYQDGDDEALMAVTLDWRDGHDPGPLLKQELIAAVRPGTDGGILLELQATFHPTAQSLEFGRTNFGFLAVRVAADLSEHFGGGRLTDSEGRTGEPDIFGQRAAWMDYSGPVAAAGDNDVIEGITYFDHPSNPDHPTRWHVRSDGWMGASVCMDGPRTTTRQQPLRLRYLLEAHGGAVDTARAGGLAREFARSGALEVEKSSERHRQFVVRRQKRGRSGLPPS